MNELCRTSGEGEGGEGEGKEEGEEKGREVGGEEKEGGGGEGGAREGEGKEVRGEGGEGGESGREGGGRDMFWWYVIKSLTYLIRKHIKTVIIIVRANSTMANITARTITTFS